LGSIPAQVSRALVQFHGGRQRSSEGELWVDHLCLFHPDTRNSASWCEATLTYYCHAEDKTYDLRQVQRALLLPNQRPQRLHPKPQTYRPLTSATAFFAYRHLDGRISHYKVRWDNPKEFAQTDADFNFGRPDDAYPIYGDFGLDELPHHLLVVEGEGCCEYVNRASDELDGVPIRAITCGSHAELRSSRVDLVARIGTLRPRSITLWPDNDDPGLAAMRALHQELARQNLAHSIVAPAELGLPLKGDVVQYLDAQHSLAVLVAKQSGVLASEPVTDLVAKTVVTADGHFMSPASRRPRQINDDEVKALWYSTYGKLPDSKQREEAKARLYDKRDSAPALHRRLWTNESATWWRPEATGRTYRVDATGIELDDDPPGVYLLPGHDDGRHTPTEVDLNGTRSDLEEVCALWRLTPEQITEIEAWLVCALGNRQTPVLFFKSPPGSGKTTLARFLTSVVDPFSSDLQPRILQDQRAFTLQLINHPVALIDNVSKIDGEVEDMLSQMVTGLSVAIRPLYTDDMIETYLRRAIILATISYDVYKGDLASRTLAIELFNRSVGFQDDARFQIQLRPFIPKVRGYIMTQLSHYYAKREWVQLDTSYTRLGDLAVVLVALGYDLGPLAQKIAETRTNLVTNDPWVEAAVELWRSEDSISFIKSSHELWDYLNTWGVPNLPSDKSAVFKRRLLEKAGFMSDYGFKLEWQRTKIFNGYRFSRLDYVTGGQE
jgi:hypothetical protein